ncbi:MAG: FAD-dependent thymidylate synthase [Calditerrivibrio sp.]|nr:FAD-dependent thymidylate synthase [Calditerrivibrio sp.]
METGLSVRLLSHTPDPERVVALSAKLCYSDASIGELLDKISEKEQTLFIEKIVKIGHHSVLEHISFTFGIEGVSRALTHQLVRHRIASYSQKSQRYVKHREDIDYIVPPSIKHHERYYVRYAALMKELALLYSEMISQDIPAEDARYILPNACETKIIVTMNARELLHFFKLRCCNRAQWEIRQMAEEMLKLCMEVAPAVFKFAGPGCVTEKCPEGEMTCGQAADVRKKYLELLKKYNRLN